MELDLSAIHAFTFRLQELRRDPKERAKEALQKFFHEEFKADEDSYEAITEALMLNEHLY